MKSIFEIKMSGNLVKKEGPVLEDKWKEFIDIDLR